GARRRARRRAAAGRQPRTRAQRRRRHAGGAAGPRSVGRGDRARGRRAGGYPIHPRLRSHPMAYESLLYDTDGAIATITLNRPERLNTISAGMPDDLEAAVHEAVADGAVKVIVLRGAGRSFCAGFDF